MRGIWSNHPQAFRRRTLLLFAVLAIYAVAKLTGALDGSSEPDDGAIALVPAGAFAYVHVDEGSKQSDQAREVAARLPHMDAILGGLARSAAPDLGLGVLTRASWISDEAAFAAVPGPAAQPEPLLVASVGDERGAKEFLVAAAGQPIGQEEHGGEEVALYAGGLASAEKDGFLLFGSLPGVRAGVDTANGTVDSLSSDKVASEVRGALPEDRFADAYVSRDAFALLQGTSLGGALDTFTDFGASNGLAVAAVAKPDGFEVKLASDLDPERAGTSPGFLTAFPSFDPTLAGLFDPDTLALLQIGDPSKTFTGLIDQAEAVQPGIAAAYERFRAQLSRRDGIDIAGDVLAKLGDEMAIGIAPGRGNPYITAAFGGVEEKDARAAVASLAGPLIAAVDPGKTGQAPTISESEIKGARVISLQISPTTTVSAAAFDGRLVATTDPKGIERAIEGKDGLTGDSGYAAVSEGGSGDPSALVFLDLGGLVSFGEPIGLTGIRNYVRFKQDFSKLGAFGVSISTDENSIDTDLTLQIDQGDQDK